MKRLGKWGIPSLLLFTGGMLGLAAGEAGRATKARQADDPPVPGVSVYLSDFELAAVPSPARENKAPVGKNANTGEPTAGEAEAPPSWQAYQLTESFAKTLVETLRKNGFAASRVKERPEGRGVLLRGVFAETDGKNRIRRAVLGAGSTNPQFLLYVGTFNLKSPDQPLYEPAAVQESDRRYGPVITLNAYIPLHKFEVPKNPTDEEVQKVCTQIAQNLRKLLEVNKEALAN